MSALLLSTTDARSSFMTRRVAAEPTFWGTGCCAVGEGGDRSLRSRHPGGDGHIRGVTGTVWRRGCQGLSRQTRFARVTALFGC